MVDLLQKNGPPLMKWENVQDKTDQKVEEWERMWEDRKACGRRNEKRENVEWHGAWECGRQSKWSKGLVWEFKRADGGVSRDGVGWQRCTVDGGVKNEKIWDEMEELETVKTEEWLKIRSKVNLCKSQDLVACDKWVDVKTKGLMKRWDAYIYLGWINEIGEWTG